MRREGTINLESKLELFEKFNSGVVSINDTDFVKIIKYGNEGFQSRPKNLYTCMVDEGDKLVERKVEGTFAFARFEDKFIKSRGSSPCLRYVTYLPLDTLVYTRNQVLEPKTGNPLTPKIHYNLDHNWFVLKPLSFVIERAEQLEEYYEDIAGYENDGLTHSRYSHPSACEVIIPEDEIIDINMTYPIFITTYLDLSKQICMDNALVVYDLFNKYVLKLIDLHGTMFQVTSVSENNFRFLINESTYLDFHVVGQEILVTGFKTSYNDFIEHSKEFLRDLVLNGYNITFSDEFVPMFNSRFLELNDTVNFDEEFVLSGHKFYETNTYRDLKKLFPHITYLTKETVIVKLKKIYVRLRVTETVSVLNVYGDASDFVNEFSKFIEYLTNEKFIVDTKEVKLLQIR